MSLHGNSLGPLQGPPGHHTDTHWHLHPPGKIGALNGRTMASSVPSSSFRHQPTLPPYWDIWRPIKARGSLCFLDVDTSKGMHLLQDRIPVPGSRDQPNPVTFHPVSELVNRRGIHEVQVSVFLQDISSIDFFRHDVCCLQ